MNRPFIVSFLSIGILCITVPTRACGPFLNEAILDFGFAILRAPETSFELEVGKIDLDKPLPGGLVMPDKIKPFQANSVLTKDWAVLLFESKGDDLLNDRDGCRTKLLATNVDLARDVAEVATFLRNGEEVEEYRALRLVMMPGKSAELRFLDAAVQNRMKERIQNRDWPVYLSEEFKLYLDGAADFSAQKWDEADAKFEQLLALPLEKRRYRSTWAAYMRARVELKKGDLDLKNSRAHFSRILKAREEGCYDSLGLGWDALRTLADQKLLDGEWNEALRYCFAVAWNGTGPISPMLELKRWLAANRQTELGMELSRDDVFVRQLFTASAISSLSSVEYWQDDVNVQPDGWLEFLKSVKMTSEEAGSAAQYAYETGDLDSTERFLKNAPSMDPTAVWLRSKLLAKKGQVRSAGRELAKVKSVREYERTFDGEIPQFSQYQSGSSQAAVYRTSQFWGEQGILHLANDRYEEALESFIKSGHWRDASYVAEQLLSREELLVYVRNRWATHEASVAGVENRFPYLLRYLTARRLARDHYFKDARPLFPPELLPVFDRYAEKYRLFRDESKPESDRAAAGWEVAQIHRRLGMELFGTEVAPDYTCWGGNYEGTERSWDRLKLEENSRRAENVSYYRNPTQPKLDRANDWWNEERFAAKVFPEPTATEQWRWRKYAKLPNAYRFHYRHVAADLAWEAAMLMPGDSEETARVYNIAGSWLEGQHPQEADVFYKAMIRRNWSTPTARRADERRWFVSHDWRSGFDPWQSLGLPSPVRLDFWNPKESME